jgi:hypothetical protein
MPAAGRLELLVAARDRGVQTVEDVVVGAVRSELKASRAPARRSVRQA